MILRVTLFLRIGGYGKGKQLYSIIRSFSFFQLDNRVANSDVVSQIQILLRNFLGVIEAMVHSVPMVVIPFVSDQPVNARQVEKTGLGKVLDDKSITADALRDTALAIMENQQTRKNLCKIQEEIAGIPDNVGAVGIIETYSRG